MTESISTVMVAMGWVMASLLGLGVLIWLGVVINKFVGRLRVMEQHRRGVLLKVSMPRYYSESDEPNKRVAQMKSKTNVAEQMFAELRGIVPSDWTKHLIFRDTLSFEIVATATEINFYVFCSRRLVEFVKNTIFASYTEVEIVEVGDYVDKLELEKAVYGYVRAIGPEYGPIRTYETMVNDSLNPLLNKMVNLRGSEVIVVQTYITPVSGGWRKRAFNYLNYLSNRQNGNGSQSTNSSGNTVWVGGTPQLAIDRDVYSGIEKKMSKKGYLAGIRVISISDDQLVAKANFDSVCRSYTQFDSPALTSFQACRFWLANRSLTKYFKLRMQPFIDWSFFKQQFIANTEEMASLFHFPGEEVDVPKVAWQKFKMAPAPSKMIEGGLFLGYNQFRGEKRRVLVGKEDRRRHFYVVGQTGTGKSEYLKHMVLQDINNGEGVCFIDPHGDVAEDILTKIPNKRVEDVIYWNPGDTEFPMGMNIMDVETAESKNIIINSFIALLYKLYDPNHTGIMGPMLERTVRNVMLTAMEEKGNTLIEALRLLTSPSFAASKLDKIKDPLVKTYWTEEMARTTDFHKSETLGYYVSKFDRFVSDVTMRNIVGQSKSAFDFREVMDQKKILIINLSKGKLGEENAAFLGTLLVPRFFVAAMSREEIPENQRQDYYLYVDEFQNFATPDFTEILSEARKYRLNLIVANQYISQINKDIRDAVFGNVGSIGAFRVGVDDASYLVHQFAPVFDEFDLVNNGTGNMYLKMLIQGKPAEPFSTGLDWKEVTAVPSSAETAEKIVADSRRKYARPRAEVEAEIIERAGLIA